MGFLGELQTLASQMCSYSGKTILKSECHYVAEGARTPAKFPYTYFKFRLQKHLSVNIKWLFSEKSEVLCIASRNILELPFTYS